VVASAQLAIEDHVPDSINDGLLDIGVSNDGESRMQLLPQMMILPLLPYIRYCSPFPVYCQASGGKLRLPFVQSHRCDYYVELRGVEHHHSVETCCRHHGFTPSLVSRKASNSAVMRASFQ
jgi:hypothetical protein